MSRSLLKAAVGAALLLPPLALAQGLPADHPPIPPGAQASPTRPAAPPPADAPLPSGHPQISAGAPAPSTDDLLAKLDATPDLLEREKTFEMAAMIGRLYLHRGRNTEARRFLAQAVEKGAPLSALILAQRGKLSAADTEKLRAARCDVALDAGLEAHARHAESRLGAGDRVGAVGCANAALPALLDALDLQGKAAQLDGDVRAALAAHEKALALDDWAPESLFARSALLYETQGEDKKALARAREGFELYLSKHPEGPRAETVQVLLASVKGAIAAGGVKAHVAAVRKARLARLGKEIPEAGKPRLVAAPGPAGGVAPAGQELPELTPEMVEAVQNTELTPEVEAGLAKLVEEGEEHLARGRFQEALGAYRRVVPFQPKNGRAQAGMAWAMVGLNRGPVADRIWGVAAQGAPQAVEALGDTLRAKGNAEAAKAVWTRLLQTAPDYARGAGLEKKLK